VKQKEEKEKSKKTLIEKKTLFETQATQLCFCHWL